MSQLAQRLGSHVFYLGHKARLPLLRLRDAHTHKHSKASNALRAILTPGCHIKIPRYLTELILVTTVLRNAP